MPSSLAVRTARRSASIPALWPAERGKPRASAQRPLPSMMIATWRGQTHGVWSDINFSNLHNLSFFVFQSCVNVFDRAVGHFLHFFRFTLSVILTHTCGFFEGLKLVHTIAAHIAHGHAGLLGVSMGNLH